MRLKVGAVALVVGAMMAAGCSSAGSRDTAQDASTHPEGEGKTLVRVEHTDSFETTLEPLAVAIEVRRVFDMPFGFSANTFLGQSDGDYFSSHVEARSARGEKMNVSCVWQRDGKTKVEFQSALPTAEHALVLKKIHEALATAATQPEGQHG